MKKHILFIALTGILCFLSQYALSQISEGGTPVSFSLSIDTKSMPAIVMPPVDVEALLREDAKTRSENTLTPFRFGTAIDVDIDIKKMGSLELLPNGDKIWLLKIHSVNALSINLIYSQFQLSKGSKFFIYNEDKTMVLGAFTPEVTNKQHNEFATDLVEGNTIILEYYEPESSNDGVINVSKVIHGYIDILGRWDGPSANCNIDVHCHNYPWLNDLKRAVALIIMGEFVCSGCLINNVKQDLTPYFLTANHCYFNNDTPITDRDPATSIFRFKYWRPGCNSGHPDPDDWKSITGATLRARLKETDFALLELSTKPPKDYKVYYAGWNRITYPYNWLGVDHVIGVHHPRGDVMKWSYGEYKETINWEDPNHKTHWRVDFNWGGTIQPGSSGSPLFETRSTRIVGQLSGRKNSPCTGTNNTDECYCDTLRIGDYGRFDESWSGGGTNSTRLRNWLDPDNTNTTYLDGTPELCPDGTVENLNLNHIVSSGPFTYEAINNIESTGTIQSEADVTYIAGNNITLKPGFSAQSGTQFQARIKGDVECGSYPPIKVVGYGPNPICIGSNLNFNVTHATHYRVVILTVNMSTVYEGSGSIINTPITVWTPSGVVPGNYIAKMTFYSPVEEITESYKILVINCKSAITSDTTDIRIEPLATDVFLSSFQSYPYTLLTNDEIVLTDLALTNNTNFTNKDLGFIIYPNPNPGTFQLQTNFPLTSIAHLKIINSIGATLYETQTLSSHTIQLPTSATGQHFVVIMLKDGNMLTQKMVIQR